MSNIPDQIVQELADLFVEAMDSSEENEVNVRTAVYTYPERGDEFVGIGICPTIPDDSAFQLTISDVLKFFDQDGDPPYCVYSHSIKTSNGLLEAPHLRFMGRYEGWLVMIDVYLTWMKSDDCQNENENMVQ